MTDWVRVKELRGRHWPMWFMKQQSRREAHHTMGLQHTRLWKPLSWQKRLSRRKQTLWLHLRSVSPARVAVYVQNFYLYLKVSPLCSFCQSRKVWLSQNSLICPLACFLLHTEMPCFCNQKETETLNSSYRKPAGKQKCTEPPPQIKGIRVSESKEKKKKPKPSCQPRVFSGHSRSTHKWMYKWRETSKV